MSLGAILFHAHLTSVKGFFDDRQGSFQQGILRDSFSLKHQSGWSIEGCLFIPERHPGLLFRCFFS